MFLGGAFCQRPQIVAQDPVTMEKPGGKELRNPFQREDGQWLREKTRERRFPVLFRILFPVFALKCVPALSTNFPSCIFFCTGIETGRWIVTVSSFFF